VQSSATWWSVPSAALSVTVSTLLVSAGSLVAG
jgi:hypothetical protein